MLDRQTAASFIIPLFLVALRIRSSIRLSFSEWMLLCARWRRAAASFCSCTRHTLHSLSAYSTFCFDALIIALCTNSADVRDMEADNGENKVDRRNAGG